MFYVLDKQILFKGYLLEQTYFLTITRMLIILTITLTCIMFIVMYDDMGRGSTDMSYTWNEYGRPAITLAYAVGALTQTGKIDAVLHGGDIAYANGYVAAWDFFLNMIGPIASTVPYLTMVGNHEIDYPNTGAFYTGKECGGECGVPVRYVFYQSM